MNQVDNKKQVAVIGAFGVDTNIYLKSDQIDFKVETNFTENIDYPGQAGNYNAQSFNRLGFNVVAIGALGDDYLGDWIENELLASKIEFIRLRDLQGTKRSVNIMYNDGTRKNFYDEKGSMEIDIKFTADDYSNIARSQLVHINIVNWSRYLIPFLRKNNIPISVDLQDIMTPYDEYRQDYIKAADYLFMSSINMDRDNSQFRLEDYVSYFQSINPDVTMVIGRGKLGAIAIKKEKRIFQETISLDRPILDTNGAGDSLATGFLSSFVFEGYDLATALFRAQINARYTCSIKASSLDGLTRSELNNYFDRLK